MSDTTPPPAVAPDDDSLGYDAYAKTLWARIEQALNRDAITGKLGDDPLVVGIFGEWGAGKSFLLNAIRNLSVARLAEQKARRENDPGDMLTIPVWFQAWKYEHEEYLHVPLLLHVMNALKDALREPSNIVAKTVDIASNAVDVVEKIAKPTGKLLKAADAAFPIVQKILGSISSFGFQLNIPDELGEWLETAAGAADGPTDDKKDVAEEKKKKAEKERKDPKSHVTTATRDGLYFYRIHELLAALTRPGKYEGRKDLFGSAKLTKETRINFVVFVDDIDRCLPEKAVAVLELIKTVFNVESFAFVLALDDEVIERGIGYRYKDYAFGNKKSEMPITGFEYLEKIVHLPFRLPALTRSDALRFIQQKEEKLLALSLPKRDGVRKWFSPLDADYNQRQSEAQAAAPGTATDSSSPLPVTRRDAVDGETRFELNLAHLVLNSFDAYVPRKLDRVVELFHQVVNIATERGPKRAMSVALGGDADPRVVLALVLLQLFHPDLYRCFKRTGNGFDVMRASFKDRTLFASFSDQDLLQWACYGTKAPSIEPGVTQTDLDVPPISVAETLQRIAKLPDDQRSPAQRVRLPIAERLLEHRATQRHVFDPLKLFSELNASLNNLPLVATDTRSYYSLLTLERSLAASEAPLDLTRAYTVVSDWENLTVKVVDVVALRDVHAAYSALISAEESEQIDVVNRAGLQGSQRIESKSASELHGLVSTWLKNQPAASGFPISAKRQLLRGLQFLAPHLAQEDASRFWELVQDSITLPEKPGELMEEPKIAALYADVGSALRQDDRFKRDFPFVMKKRFKGHSVDDEPLPGFVRISAGEFSMGHGSERNNPPRRVDILSAFYISRTATTVEQYARFVQDNGYVADDAIWGNDQMIPPTLVHPSGAAGKRYLLPDDWSNQLVHATRPVVSVTWFEARAYARWLNLQMRTQLDSAGLEKYGVMLPTEPQWERAARAKSLRQAHVDMWPWGDSASAIGQLANVDSSDIKHASSVGMFAPSAIGVCDMSGNTWEWMDNRYEESDSNPFARVANFGKPAKVFTQELALRGGSWVLGAERACCSYRIRMAPTASDDFVGFRVVLSIARA